MARKRNKGDNVAMIGEIMNGLLKGYEVYGKQQAAAEKAKYADAEEARKIEKHEGWRLGEGEKREAARDANRNRDFRYATGVAKEIDRRDNEWRKKEAGYAGLVEKNAAATDTYKARITTRTTAISELDAETKGIKDTFGADSVELKEHKRKIEDAQKLNSTDNSILGSLRESNLQAVARLKKHQGTSEEEVTNTLRSSSDIVQEALNNTDFSDPEAVEKTTRFIQSHLDKTNAALMGVKRPKVQAARDKELYTIGRGAMEAINRGKKANAKSQALKSKQHGELAQLVSKQGRDPQRQFTKEGFELEAGIPKSEVQKKAFGEMKKLEAQLKNPQPVKRGRNFVTPSRKDLISGINKRRRFLNLPPLAESIDETKDFLAEDTILNVAGDE